MEALSINKVINSEDYLPLIEVKLAGVTKTEFTEPGTYRMSVDPKYRVFVAGQHLEHADLDDKYGVRLAETLTEGYVRVGSGGRIEEIEFKPPEYQQYHQAPEFASNTAQLRALQGAIKLAIRGYFDQE